MWTRRQTLRWLGALPIAIAACGDQTDGAGQSDESAVTAGGNVDVIVVGAGMSGLRAAQLLTQAGKRVVVLEARDRIGGRVFTERSHFGMPIELGASWLHDSTTNPVTAVAKTAGVRTLASDYSERVWRDGDLLKESVSDSIVKTFEGQLARATKGAKPEESMRDALERTLRGSAATIDREGFEWALSVNVEYDLGAEAELISASRFNDGTDSEENNLIVDGYDGVVAAVAGGTAIRLRETVRRIEQTETSVRVHASSGVFSAKHVIVTLPVNVLKSGSIEFSPPLSNKKKEALGRLGMGVLSKTFLRFPKAFWPTESDFLGRMTPDKRWAEFLNVAKFLKAPVLAALNGGKHAREIEASSDEAIVRDAMAALRTMFKDAPDPIGILQSRWSQDPLALGSYSFLPVGALATDRATLGEPEGAIFFAGEACSVKRAETVHGAYLSGETAAKALLKAA